MRFPLLRRRRCPWLGSAGAVPLLAALLSLCAAGANAADSEGPRSVLLAQAADPAAEAEDESAAGEDASADDVEPSQAEPEAAEPAPPDTPPPGVEVMRVRGRGAGAIEADVPSSLTVFDAATITALGAQDISDLSRVTPNVNIVQPGATQATFFVRGVGLSDFSSNAAGAVTIFQDDVALNAPAIQTGQLFDVESVDIAKGPQGTGPFRNASAGAIRVRSRRPTGNYNAALRVSLGRYDTKGDKGAKDALIQDYEGALEMPIVAESLSSRFAFRLREADPYRKNGCGDLLPFEERRVGQAQCGEGLGGFFENGIHIGKSNVPFGLPRWVNDQHNWAARGTLRFQPPDTELDLLLNAHGSRLDQDSTLGQAIGTRNVGVEGPIRFAGKDDLDYIDRDVLEEYNEVCGFTPGVGCANPRGRWITAKRLAADRSLDKRPYRGDYNQVGQTTRDAWGGFVSGERELFADAKLFLLASYDQYERFQEQDSDYTPVRQFEALQIDEAWQTYNELRLDGELQAEPVEWSLGGYYLREQLDNETTVLLNEVVAIGAQSKRIYTQIIDSYAVWGEFGWDFADDFTLEGGVRFNWERKQFDFQTGGLSGTAFRDREVATWQTPTGQIILKYHIDEEKTAYARYTRGFKAGHFNGLADVSSSEIDLTPADEEYNDAWEVGLRAAWLDRRLQLSGAFFYYRYENYQIFLFTDSASAVLPPVLEIVNAKQAENFGVEAEVTLAPLRGWVPRLVEGLRVSANFGWLHAEYLNFTTFRQLQSGPLAVANFAIDYSGKQLQNSPEYKVSGTAEWTFDLGRFGYLIPRYDINWSDDVFFDPNEGRGSVDPTGGPNLVEYGAGQKAYFLHNVRLAYRTPTSNVEVAGWIRNVEDQVYKTYAFDASRFTGLVINYPGEPRTIGVDVSFTF